MSGVIHLILFKRRPILIHVYIVRYYSLNTIFIYFFIFLLEILKKKIYQYFYV